MICKDVAKRKDDGKIWLLAVQEAIAGVRFLQVQFLLPVACYSEHLVFAMGVAPFQIADRVVNLKCVLEMLSRSRLDVVASRTQRGDAPESEPAGVL